jgi:hypothetical protein
MKADTASMGTEISYDELMCAWAPLVDVSMALDEIMASTNGGDASKIIGAMDEKVKRALEPIKECLDRIEEENPDQFS